MPHVACPLQALLALLPADISSALPPDVRAAIAAGNLVGAMTALHAHLGLDEQAGGMFAGGYRRGDRVIACVAHDKVAIGDAGTVIGPATSEVADKEQRVLVEFDDGKGQVNYHASSQISLVALAGGYRRGDRVTACVAHDKVAIGDAGTVIGPATSGVGADQAQRVLVELDGGKGRANYLASSQISLVALAGGYRRGDRVTACVAHDNVAIGDAGTVIGPATSEGADQAQRVLVEFDGGKGQVNYHASSQISLVALAGGYIYIYDVEVAPARLSTVFNVAVVQEAVKRRAEVRPLRPPARYGRSTHRTLTCVRRTPLKFDCSAFAADADGA
jgi:hypothetical protein